MFHKIRGNGVASAVRRDADSDQHGKAPAEGKFVRRKKISRSANDGHCSFNVQCESAALRAAVWDNFTHIRRSRYAYCAQPRVTSLRRDFPNFQGEFREFLSLNNSYFAGQVVKHCARKGTSAQCSRRRGFSHHHRQRPRHRFQSGTDCSTSR